MHQIDPTLLDIAAWQVDVWEHVHNREKRAFVPAGGDPAAGGGAPPMDPAAAGGAPPPGGDPMAAMMGGGGAPPPPPAGGMDPSMIQQIVQATLQAQGGAGGAGAAAAASPTGPAGVGQKMKIDPTMVYLQLGRLTKLMLFMFEKMGWELPPDTLNDDMMIQQAAGQAPPGGAGGAPPAPPAGDPAAAAGPAPVPGIGQSPAITPIEPAGGAPKTAADDLLSAPWGGNLLDVATALDLLIGHSDESCSA